MTRHHTETVFSHFLRAFRSRGVGLILADQYPSRLFESFYSLPSIKMLFRLSHDSSCLFTNRLDEQDSFALLKDRDVIILDGVNSRKFAFRTLDHFYRGTALEKRKSPTTAEVNE